MKRTAADFLAEAKDPYELTLPGRKTPLRPRAWSHLTHDEQKEHAAAQWHWGKALEAGRAMDFPDDQTPFFVELRYRFGKDFDAFWKEASKWPQAAIKRMIDEVDEYYDPTPGDPCDKCGGSGKVLGDGSGEGARPRLSSVGS